MKKIYSFLIAVLLGILFLIFLLNDSKNALLQEHCAMLPGSEGCEGYAEKYIEKSHAFTRSVEGLSPAKESTIHQISKENMMQLEINPVKKIINGNEIRMYGYNGQIPGPLLKVDQGETVFVNVINNLEQETTVHWHGIRLKNEFDGVPDATQKAIQPGESFIYELTFPDAGIYWYHPHVREDYQQELGLYGNIFVVPSEKNYYNKVNREEFIFLDDIQLTGEDITPAYTDKTNQVLMGRFGNVMLINGKENYNLNVKKGEVVRFYITNAANTRLFNFSITGVKIKIIGSDGGNYENEFFDESVIIAPSERAVIEVFFEKAGTYKILNNNPLQTYVLGTVTVMNEKVSDDFSLLFSALQKNDFTFDYVHYIDKNPDVSLKLDVDIPGMGMMGQHMQMNHADENGLEWEDVMRMMNLGSSSNTIDWKIVDEQTGKSNMDIMYHWNVGDVVKMRITNDEYSAHPMQHPIHLHGQRFLVLAQDGVTNENLVWKDTVLVPTGKSVDLLVEMTNPGTWMAHCHIAEHLSDGMMFEFEVSK